MFSGFLSTDMMKLQQAKEQNDRLDAENRALRERVRTIESEKQNLRGQVDIYWIYLPKNKTNKKTQKLLQLPLHFFLLCLFSWQ